MRVQSEGSPQEGSLVAEAGLALCAPPTQVVRLPWAVGSQGGVRSVWELASAVGMGPGGARARLEHGLMTLHSAETWPVWPADAT